MKDKLKSGRKYLQTTYLMKDQCLDKIMNTENSEVKKSQSNQKMGQSLEEIFHQRGHTDGT